MALGSFWCVDAGQAHSDLLTFGSGDANGVAITYGDEGDRAAGRWRCCCGLGGAAPGCWVSSWSDVGRPTAAGLAGRRGTSATAVTVVVAGLFVGVAPVGIHAAAVGMDC